MAALTSGAALPSVANDEVELPDEVRRGGHLDRGRAGRRRLRVTVIAPGPGRAARRLRRDVRAAARRHPGGAGLVPGPVRRLGLGGRPSEHVDAAVLPAAATTPSRRAGSTRRLAWRRRRAPSAAAPTVGSDAPRPRRWPTVLEVRAADRPGVVYLVCAALARLDVAVRSAHVDTLGPQAVDVFYLQEAAAGVLSATGAPARRSRAAARRSRRRPPCPAGPRAAGRTDRHS